MPIDIDQLKGLVKLAAAIQQDKGSQAMAAAAQSAKPAGGIPLPKAVEEETPAEGALSAEQQQREQEKLEQQRRKEIESKENEIRGLQHELDLERVERQKMTNRHELDMQVRQEEARLKAEKDKLEKERFQLIQEKARQDNLFKAEEMKHQAELDKATYKQEATIAKAQAKSTADLAKQQAQTLIATSEKARQASDKYYADASARLTKEHPAISPALQSQLDGAIASLDRFKKVNSKQTALPRPGTPPDLTKLANVVKWAGYEDFYGGVLPGDYIPDASFTYNPPRQPVPANTQSAGVAAASRVGAVPAAVGAGAAAVAGGNPVEQQIDPEERDLAARGVVVGGSAYDALRATAYFRNEQSKYEHLGDTERARYYERLGNTAQLIARRNYASASKGDRAAFDSYLDTKTTANGFNSHKAYHTTESQFDRDAGAFRDQLARERYERETGSFKKGLLWVADLFGDIYAAPHNAITDAAASSRNADRFGANRFWNTTFDDDSVADYYHRSINEQGYSDSVAADVGRVAGEGALSVVSVIPIGKGAVMVGKGGTKLLTGAARSGARTAASAGASTAARTSAGTAARSAAAEGASTAAGTATRAGAGTAAQTAATAAPRTGLGRFAWPAAKFTGAVAAYGGAKYGLDQLAPRPSGTPGYDPGLINLGPPAGYGYTDPVNMQPSTDGPRNPLFRLPGYPNNTPYERAPYDFTPEYDPNLDPYSVFLPSAETPGLAKRASNTGTRAPYSPIIAQVANIAYGHRAGNNPARYGQTYSANAKFVSDLIKMFTGGMVNPYMQIKKHDMFVNPRLPVTATNLMQSAIYEAGNTGRSNVHRVVANAAEQKHNPSFTPENYNGTTYRPKGAVGRI